MNRTRVILKKASNKGNKLNKYPSFQSRAYFIRLKKTKNKSYFRKQRKHDASSDTAQGRTKQKLGVFHIAAQKQIWLITEFVGLGAMENEENVIFISHPAVPMSM